MCPCQHVARNLIRTIVRLRTPERPSRGGLCVVTPKNKALPGEKQYRNDYNPNAECNCIAYGCGVPRCYHINMSTWLEHDPINAVCTKTISDGNYTRYIVEFGFCMPSNNVVSIPKSGWWPCQRGIFWDMLRKPGFQEEAPPQTKWIFYVLIFN